MTAIGGLLQLPAKASLKPGERDLPLMAFLGSGAARTETVRACRGRRAAHSRSGFLAGAAGIFAAGTERAPGNPGHLRMPVRRPGNEALR